MKHLLLVLAFLGPLNGMDRTAQREVQSMRRPALERPMRAVSDACRPATFFAALLAVAVLDGASGVATARLALLTAVPVNVAVEGLKRATDRTRPDGTHRRSNASFPSSHAANAFALAAVLGRRWRRAAPALWIGAGTIAFSRLYLNRHYLSDVLVGAAIGVLGAWMVARLSAGGSGRDAQKA
jgi:membrane-associated phospholipid phosphatase